MRWWVLLVLPLACAAPRHAELFSKRGRALTGARWVTLTGGDEDVAGLERMLLRKGFRVSRKIPGVTSEVPTKYVLSIDGICTSYASEWLERDVRTTEFKPLRVDIYETAASERVFSARLDSDSDCPTAFFAEVAEALDQRWVTPQVGDGNDPDLPRRR